MPLADWSKIEVFEQFLVKESKKKFILFASLIPLENESKKMITSFTICIKKKRLFLSVNLCKLWIKNICSIWLCGWEQKIKKKCY